MAKASRFLREVFFHEKFFLFTKNIIMDTIYVIMIGLELRKKYKSGSAAEIIRDAILFGEITGEIGQNEFADSLGISRMPVREALITLEYHGLIEKLPNQHVKIADINDRAVKDSFYDMSLLELEVIKNLPAEKLESLSTLSQIEFHRALYKNTASPLRRTFLRIITETYLMFAVEHSDGRKLDAVFGNLKLSLEDQSMLKAGYAVYSEALAAEMIRIRKDKRSTKYAEP